MKPQQITNFFSNCESKTLSYSSNVVDIKDLFESHEAPPNESIARHRFIGILDGNLLNAAYLQLLEDTKVDQSTTDSCLVILKSILCKF